MKKDQLPSDLRNLLLSKKEFDKIAKNFYKKMIPLLKKKREMIFTLKGAPKAHGYSLTFGPYTGKNLALYISKNTKKSILKKVDLSKFYSDIEKMLIQRIGDKIYWRSNLLVNKKTGEPAEVEFIPMAFRGEFLLNVLKKCEIKIMDEFWLIHAAVIATGRLFHELISEKGYRSTFPRYIIDIEKEGPDSFTEELENADFYIDLQYTEKTVFSLKETELLEKFSESSLELKMGFELIKEAIPFIIQYQIKKDFPKQRSKKTITKPDFIILNPLDPIAIYCDSYRYHQRKKDQIMKDKRIDRKLQRLGFTVFRFSEEEITRNIEGCIEEVKEHYFGKEHALTPNEIFMRMLTKIDPRKLSKWEVAFIDTLTDKLNQGKSISLKEERILQNIFTRLKLG